MIPDEAIGANLVLLCGYFLLPALRGEPSAELLQRVKAAGGGTLFDPGWDPDGWTETTADEIRSFLPFVDVLLPNEAEATALTGYTDPMTAARELQRLSGGWIVVKRGADGCLGAGPAGKKNASTRRRSRPMTRSVRVTPSTQDSSTPWRTGSIGAKRSTSP